MKTDKLVKVSTYAQSIGKSVELVRTWIRTSKWTKDKEYVVIDGITFVNLENMK